MKRVDNESNLFFRKSRSPGKRTSRSPSRSPGRRGSPYGSDENDRVNNNDFLQQKSVLREREEEKRRLQAEMRRREQELLAKIKEQQRELESMKHEKGKVMLAENGYLFKNPLKMIRLFSSNWAILQSLDISWPNKAICKVLTNFAIPILKNNLKMYGWQIAPN